MTTGRLHRASLRTLAGMRVSTASRETRTAATPHVPGPLLERSTPAALVVAPAGQGLFTTDRTVRVKPSTWRLKSASRLTASASRWGVARHKGAPRDTSSSSSTPGLRRALGHHHRITTPALHSAPSRTVPHCQPTRIPACAAAARTSSPFTRNKSGVQSPHRPQRNRPVTDEVAGRFRVFTARHCTEPRRSGLGG